MDRRCCLPTQTNRVVVVLCTTSVNDCTFRSTPQQSVVAAESTCKAVKHKKARGTNENLQFEKENTAEKEKKRKSAHNHTAANGHAHEVWHGAWQTRHVPACPLHLISSQPRVLTFLWKMGLVCPPKPLCLWSYRRLPCSTSGVAHRPRAWQAQERAGCSQGQQRACHGTKHNLDGIWFGKMQQFNATYYNGSSSSSTVHACPQNKLSAAAMCDGWYKELVQPQVVIKPRTPEVRLSASAGAYKKSAPIYDSAGRQQNSKTFSEEDPKVKKR